MDKINILHIYQNSKVGGIQQQIFNIISAYDKEIFNPIFCCLGPRREIGADIERLGIEFVPLNRSRYHNFSPGILIDLFRLMKKRQVHIVRTHKYRSNLYGRIAAWLAGVPVIIASEHNIYIDKELRLSRRIINKILSGVTDRMIAVSEAIRDNLIEYDHVDPGKVLVIHNGVNTDRFNITADPGLLRERYSVGNENFVVGFIGRMVPQKGLTYLLDTAAALCGRFGNLRLLIAGDGSLMNEMKSKAEKLGIADKVRFLGERRDIPELLSCFDVFVMPSIKEGLPNVLLEAMAAGRPVVATRIGGIPEIVRNGVSGILVKPADPAALAAAVELLISDSQLAKKMGRAGREFVMENCSMTQTSQKWQLLYQALLKEKG